MLEEAPQYISIDDIPRSGAHALEAYPYKQWAEDIPSGKALEITDQLNGRKPKHVRATIAAALKRHELPIIVVVRKERLFIVHPQQDA